jgi:hypothetical protein
MKAQGCSKSVQYDEERNDRVYKYQVGFGDANYNDEKSIIQMDNRESVQYQISFYNKL